MIVNTVFLVVIFALTIYGVFHGEDLGAMMEAMRRADVRWLLPGLFCVVFFIWGESIIIWYMMHSFQIPVKRRTCFLFSSVGFFFSCITPSASGGQPMQLYYMKKEKISLPVSTVGVAFVTVCFVGVLFGQGFLHRYLTEILPVFYLGIGLNVFCVTAMLILVFHPALARTILVLGLKIVEKLHLMKRKLPWKSTRILQRILAPTKWCWSMSLRLHLYRGLLYLQQHGLYTAPSIYQAFPLSPLCCCRRSFPYRLTCCRFREEWESVRLCFLPFSVRFGSTLLLPAMVLSRGLGYYGELLVSAVFTIVAQLTIGNTKREKRGGTTYDRVL